MKLAWIDCEMTGLNCLTEDILELAIIITDKNLTVIAEKSWVLFCEEKKLAAMDEWCRTTHTKSGLYQACLNAQHSNSTVEEECLAFLAAHTDMKKVFIAGSSVYHDVIFLKRHMPKITEWCHYRIIDVSSIKVLYEFWNTTNDRFIGKRSIHRAMDDIRESIEELKFYRENFFFIL